MRFGSLLCSTLLCSIPRAELDESSRKIVKKVENLIFMENNRLTIQLSLFRLHKVAATMQNWSVGRTVGVIMIVLVGSSVQL